MIATWTSTVALCAMMCSRANASRHHVDPPVGGPATAATRPQLVDEATFGVGAILVHYATNGVDVPFGGDANGNDVPDFVEEVATTANDALERFVALGFRRPADDGALG
ncbi:MAG: hypothetical protein AB7L94_23065, partial [Kofleriaceae bacterium]